MEVVGFPVPTASLALYDMLANLPNNKGGARLLRWCLNTLGWNERFCGTNEERVAFCIQLANAAHSPCDRLRTALSSILGNDAMAKHLAAWNPDNENDGRFTMFQRLAVRLSVGCSTEHRAECIDSLHPEWMFVLERLVALGADPFYNLGRSLLAQRLHPDIFRFVFELAAVNPKCNEILNAKDAKTNITPLTAQLSARRAWAVEALLKGGPYGKADPNLCREQIFYADRRGAVPLSMFSVTPMEEVINSLPLAEGPDKPLYHLVRMLLKAGARPSGLRDAIRRGGQDCTTAAVIRALVEAGAELRDTEDADSPLYVASEKQLWAAYDELIDCLAPARDGSRLPSVEAALRYFAGFDADRAESPGRAATTVPGLYRMLAAGRWDRVDRLLEAIQPYHAIIVDGLDGAVGAAMHGPGDMTAVKIFQVVRKYEQRPAERPEVARALSIALSSGQPMLFAAIVAAGYDPLTDAEFDKGDAGALHFEALAATRAKELMAVMTRWPARRLSFLAGKALKWILDVFVYEPGDYCELTGKAQGTFIGGPDGRVAKRRKLGGSDAFEYRQLGGAVTATAKYCKSDSMESVRKSIGARPHQFLFDAGLSAVVESVQAIESAASRPLVLTSFIEIAWYHMIAYTERTGLASPRCWQLTPWVRDDEGALTYSGSWTPRRAGAEIGWKLTFICKCLEREGRPFLPTELIEHTARLAYGMGWQADDET